MNKTSYRIGRWGAAVLAMLGLGTALFHVVKDNTPKGDVRPVAGYKPWSPETLKVAETIAVQDGGRIKPLSTFAGFSMLSLHGARSMRISGDSTEYNIKPTEWLLDALFRPQFAIHQPTFRVDNSSAIEAIGVKPRGKRDRYSYADLEPGREKLGELSQAYRAIEQKKRDPVQTQIIDLSNNLQVYESFLGYFSFARNGIILRGSGQNGAPDKRADVSALMQTAPTIREQIDQSNQGKSLEPRLRDLLQQLLDASNFAKFSLFLFPPVEAGEEIWLSAGNTIMSVMDGTSKKPDQAVEDIQSFETVARLANTDEAAFRDALSKAGKSTAARAKARDEYRSVPLEASYYHRNWFLHALAWFLAGTLASLAMWTFGRGLAGRIAMWICAGLTLIGAVYCTVAIVKRCIIMERPPVGNLYDTIIFIGTTAVFLALLLEWFNRGRFALGIAPIVGAGLIILARRFELGDANDHMDPLVAVLDSNFWLTTHVITITLGYSAGLLAAFLSTTYILMRALGLDQGDKELRRIFTRTVYGVICFTLFLSLVGTVLGGIWANYSWGRFWGWDPKENGALMIVLWTLSILHARLGGYIREWGIHLASVFTAIVVVFSWWHVNFLGVGLHNYGFTAGKDAIWWFYGIISGVLVVGATAWAVDLSARQAPKAVSAGTELPAR